MNNDNTENDIQIRNRSQNEDKSKQLIIDFHGLSIIDAINRTNYLTFS